MPGGEKIHGVETQTLRYWGRILMLMAAGFAIELAYSVETSYAVPALLDTGLDEKYASIMWVFGPLLGTVFQGYLGSASDSCKCSWGKRRPFIFALGVCVAISMALFAYRRVLFGGTQEEGGVTLFVFTAVSFVAMNFSIDQFELPVRMYLLDSVTIETSNRANDMYLAMLALGSLFGSMISAIDWDSTQHSTMNVEYQVQVVFTIALILFILCVTITMFSVQEGSFQQQSLTLASVAHTVRPRPPSHITWPREDIKLQPETFLKMNGMMSCGVKSNMIEIQNQSQNCSFLRDVYNSFLSTKEFISCLSKSMKLLWLTVFLDWCVFLSESIFFTDFVGKVVYGGSPNSEEVTLNSLYEEGVRVACWCITLEDAVIIVYSLLLSERISSLIGHGPLLIGGHIMHFVAIGMTMMSPSVYTVMVMSVSSAIFTANLMTIPYVLIPYYKDTGQLLQKPWPHDGDTTGKAVSLLGSAMMLAQVVVGLFMGTLIDVFGTARVVIVASFVGVSLAGLGALFVRTKTVVQLSIPPCVKYIYRFPRRLFGKCLQ